MIERLALYLSYPMVQRALIAGILIALCASLLGVTLVLKRYSFIGDGLSHVAFGAAAVAGVLHFSDNMLLVLPVTIGCAVLLLCLGERARIKGDAAIAILSVGALAVGYLLMNQFPTGVNVSADVCSALFGSTSILTLRPVDVWVCVGMSVVVIAVYVVFYHKIFSVTFDETFAQGTGIRVRLYQLLIAAVTGVIIVLAMKMVGSLLVSALIIFPALSAMRTLKSFRAVMICSGILSIICTAIGFLIAVVGDMLVGPTVVTVYLVVFGLFWLAGMLLKKN